MLWRRGAALASALLPGLGQLMMARVFDGVLFAFAALWVHGLLSGLAEPGQRLEAFGLGAFGLERGFARPVAVVFTMLALTLHAWSSWDAVSGQRPHPRRDGQDAASVSAAGGPAVAP
jgi:hypothetical protein